MTAENLPEFDFKRQIRWGLAAILLFFGVVIGWSYLAPLSSGAVASGRIVVDSNRQVVQVLEGGVVQDILVRDGDRVEAGMPILRLRTVELDNDIMQLQSERLALLAQEARLEAERTGRDQLIFPAEFKDGENRDRKLALMQRQTELFLARKNSLEIEVGIFGRQMAQFEEQIEGYQAQIFAFATRVDLMNEEIATQETLLSKGLGTNSRLLDLKGQVAAIASQKAERQSWIAEAKIQLSEKELEILRARQRFAESAADELSSLRAKIFDVEDRLVSAREKLDRSVVLAPAEGVVFNSSVHTVGGVIPRGETVMEIVPQLDRLVVEADASPLDVDVIQVGGAAKIRFASLSAKLTPLLDGKVIHLAADSSTSDDGERVYLMRLTIPLAELEKLGDIAIIPGMPVEVLIDKGEQTLVAYLAEPLTSVMFRSLVEE